ncbi:RPM1-interacting protein 4 (RIN4) family protein isoform 2 [Theobroma cacao]|uniref:RPM1-interacting protein 4 (RIN4) family protein isoform 2 n=1 Tax=Theobroma cacao TaxID=3641 RepID=A0A061DL47_THECC|nr:RPM1-interacting protein 4 (RIN4) family protein isoform 2 [Theobroma cacao]
MADKGRPLPKFGEWDVNDPASAEGFTVIFNKARNEKKTGGKVDSPGRKDPTYKQGAVLGKPQSICKLILVSSGSEKMVLLYTSCSCRLKRWLLQRKSFQKKGLIIYTMAMPVSNDPEDWSCMSSYDRSWWNVLVASLSNGDDVSVGREKNVVLCLCALLGCYLHIFCSLVYSNMLCYGLTLLFVTFVM